MRTIQLRIIQYRKSTGGDNLYILWKEENPLGSTKKQRYYNFLPDVTGEEVALTFRGLHSLVYNIEKNLHPGKPQVSSVRTPPQDPFLTLPFATMCEELNIRHEIDP